MCPVSSAGRLVFRSYVLKTPLDWVIAGTSRDRSQARSVGYAGIGHITKSSRKRWKDIQTVIRIDRTVPLTSLHPYRRPASRFGNQDSQRAQHYTMCWSSRLTPRMTPVAHSQIVNTPNRGRTLARDAHRDAGFCRYGDNATVFPFRR
jgi:hypothetical protein